MRVHIVLKDDVIETGSRLDDVVRHLVEIAQLKDLNRQRLETLGVLTADVEVTNLEALRGLEEVAAVEPDRERFAVLA